MKTIIFFDVDNTIYNNTLGLIPEQTKRLIFELSKKEDVILGLATGRGLSKLSIIEAILPCFTYKVLVNGGVVMKKGDIIYDAPIEKSDIKEVIEIATSKNLSVGMVGLLDDAVNVWDEKVEKGMTLLRGIAPKVDPNFYINHPVYQLWLFGEHETTLLDMSKQIPKFKSYPWHYGGADFTYGHINKAYGIKKVLEHEKDYQLICVGDGANDIMMIEMADIGIAMSNTRFPELKEKADHLAPHIMDDQLYNFFKSIHLI